jgi:8-oxo-dGTP pyrophosphatase MutT (NUDIX family)
MPHIHELIDFVVSAFVVNQERVLLVKHKKLGVWLPVGGHIELNEDPEMALFREIEEECGITAKDLVVLSDKPIGIKTAKAKFLYRPNYMDIHVIEGKHKHVALNYFLVSEIEDIKLAEKEHDEIGWFPAKDWVKLNLYPEINYYANKAVEKAKIYGIKKSIAIIDIENK